jgi:hypothetical protein
MSLSEPEFGELIATALRSEVGGGHRATKTLMRWTNASERTAKNWLAGTHCPSGLHLIELAKSSDEIFNLVLALAERKPVVTSIALVRLRSQLVQTVTQIDRQLG